MNKLCPLILSCSTSSDCSSRKKTAREKRVKKFNQISALNLRRWSMFIPALYNYLVKRYSAKKRFCDRNINKKFSSSKIDPHFCPRLTPDQNDQRNNIPRNPERQDAHFVASQRAPMLPLAEKAQLATRTVQLVQEGKEKSRPRNRTIQAPQGCQPTIPVSRTLLAKILQRADKYRCTFVCYFTRFINLRLHKNCKNMGSKAASVH